jgi:predicted HAD superfamily phosphohydrolase YqeG
MSALQAEIVFVDVDDTLVRSAGSKRIPITPVAERVVALKDAGATLYCWSTGGAAYAREVARELGLEHCFVAFLPKPTIMLDDQPPAEWRLCRHVHPFNVGSIET